MVQYLYYKGTHMRLNLRRIQHLTTLLLLAFLYLPINVLAVGNGSSGGGKWKEGDLTHFLQKLSIYFKTKEAMNDFPEVIKYNSEHKDEPFDIVLLKIKPILVDEESVTDQWGNSRDCFSSQNELGIRFFKCAISALPQKDITLLKNGEKSELYGSMYRLVLHEAFVNVGIEFPLSQEIPSDYIVASRLNVHLEYFPEWVPGIGSSAPIQQVAKYFKIYRDSNRVSPYSEVGVNLDRILGIRFSEYIFLKKEDVNSNKVGIYICGVVDAGSGASTDSFVEIAPGIHGLCSIRPIRDILLTQTQFDNMLRQINKDSYSWSTFIQKTSLPACQVGAISAGAVGGVFGASTTIYFTGPIGPMFFATVGALAGCITGVAGSGVEKIFDKNRQSAELSDIYKEFGKSNVPTFKHKLNTTFQLSLDEVNETLEYYLIKANQYSQSESMFTKINSKASIFLK